MKTEKKEQLSINMYNKEIPKAECNNTRFIGIRFDTLNLKTYLVSYMKSKMLNTCS